MTSRHLNSAREYEDIQARIQEELARLKPDEPKTSSKKSWPTSEPPPGYDPTTDRLPYCATCGGWGVINYDVDLKDPRFGKAFPCPNPTCPARRDRQQQRADHLLRDSGLGGDYPAFRLEHFAGERYANRDANTLAVQMAQHLVRRGLIRAKNGREYAGLYLYGGCGVGKSALAAAIANERRERYGDPTLAISVPDLLDKLRGGYDRGAKHSFDALLEQVCAVKVLVLDDLGAQQAKPWAAEKLFQIVNRRAADRLMTLVTSNLSPAEAAAAFGAAGSVEGGRILSRLKGLCFAAQMSGADLRQADGEAGREAA